MRLYSWSVRSELLCISYTHNHCRSRACGWFWTKQTRIHARTQKNASTNFNFFLPFLAWLYSTQHTSLATLGSVCKHMHARAQNCVSLQTIVSFLGCMHTKLCNKQLPNFWSALTLQTTATIFTDHTHWHVHMLMIFYLPLRSCQLCFSWKQSRRTCLCPPMVNKRHHKPQDQLNPQWSYGPVASLYIHCLKCKLSCYQPSLLTKQ